jgi:sugar lactone lactonase YvrE
MQSQLYSTTILDNDASGGWSLMSTRGVFEQLTFVGADLARPECVLCTRDGSIYASHWEGGGVTHLKPDGTQIDILPGENPHEVRTNGFAIDRDGSFLVANLGDEGGIWRLDQGRLEPFLLEVDGTRLPPSNFVLVDHKGRYWITVSTRRTPRDRGYRPDVADGFIVLVDADGARVVADGLGYTNEVQLDSAGEWLYVNETFGRKLSRFRVSGHGDLSVKETVTEFGRGTFPDGLCFDQEGFIWVTSIVSNRVIRVSPHGAQDIVIEDADADHVNEVEDAFFGGRLGRPHLDSVSSRRLRNISSLAFGGPDLRTAYVGCILGKEIASFPSRVGGVPPVHWCWR